MWSDIAVILAVAVAAMAGLVVLSLTTHGPAQANPISASTTAPSSTVQLSVTTITSSSSTASTTLAIVPINASESQPNASVQGGDNWTSFILDGYDSRYQTGSTVTANNASGLAQRWALNTFSAITSTPVVLNGSIYFADWAGTVWRVNLSDGSVIWKTYLAGNTVPGTFPISSTPALGHGEVYVGFGPKSGPGGRVHVTALSQVDGHVIWNDSINASMKAIWASPTLSGNMLYIGLSSSDKFGETNRSFIGQVLALNAQTGATVWSFNTIKPGTGGAGVWSSVVVDNGLNSIYFGTGNAYNVSVNGSLYSDSVVSLNASTGKLNWFYQAHRSGTPLADLDFGSTANLFSVEINGSVYKAIGIGSKDGSYYVLDRTDGKLLRKFGLGTSAQGGGHLRRARIRLSKQ